MREIIKYTYQIDSGVTTNGGVPGIYAVGAGKAKYIPVGSHPYAGSPELLSHTCSVNRTVDALSAMMKRRLFYILPPV